MVARSESTMARTRNIQGGSSESDKISQQQDSNVFQSLSTESKRVISNRGVAQLRKPLYVVMLWVLTDLLATGADDVTSPGRAFTPTSDRTVAARQLITFRTRMMLVAMPIADCTAKKTRTQSFQLQPRMGPRWQQQW